MTKLNQRLAMVLGGLIVVYVLAIVFHAAGRESNIQGVTFHVDTAGATEIDVYPHKMHEQQIQLLRGAGTWRVRSGSAEAPTAGGSAQALLGSLATVPTHRLISRSKDKWDKYNVGDTSGTRVVVYKGKDAVADYYIGGSADRSYYGGGTAYIRENGHDNVYAVDGYFYGLVDKAFADWRDKTFLRFNTSDITAVHFQGPSGYVLSKKDSLWRLKGAPVSTDSVNRYLGHLEAYAPDGFADDFTTTGSPDRSIVFKDTSATAATIMAWKRSGGGWVLHSSQNPQTYFAISDSLMARDLWREPSKWRPSGHPTTSSPSPRPATLRRPAVSSGRK